MDERKASVDGEHEAGWGLPRPVEVLLDVTMTPPDGQAERQSFRYQGMWWRRAQEAVCRYEEHGHATVTVLKFSDKEMILLRQGEITCRQVFRAGEAGRALYRTAHGTFPMSWRCRSLDVDMALSERNLLAQLWFSYDLELGGTFMGSYEVAIRIREQVGTPDSC